MAFQLCEVYLVSAAGAKLPIAAVLNPVIICDENGGVFIENCVFSSLPSTFLDFTAQKGSTWGSGRQLANKEKNFLLSISKLLLR